MPKLKNSAVCAISSAVSAPPKPPIIPQPPKVTARAMRPLWRDLILRVWGTDPLQCPCCQGTMKVVDTFFRAGEIEFFLRLQGLWEGVIDIPPPPDPPFDIDTFEPIEPPWQAIRGWIPADEGELSFDLFDQRPDFAKPVEIPREDGSILVLDSARGPGEHRARRKTAAEKMLGNAERMIILVKSP